MMSRGQQQQQNDRQRADDAQPAIEDLSARQPTDAGEEAARVKGGGIDTSPTAPQDSFRLKLGGKEA